MPPSSPPPSRHHSPSSRLLSLSQNPPLTFRHMLSPSTPPRHFGTGPQHPPSFQHRSAKQDRTANRGPPFGQIWPNKGPLFGKALRSVIFDQTKALRSVLFGRTVPKGRRASGAEKSQCQKSEGRRKRVGAGEPSGCRESMCRGVEEGCLRRGKGRGDGRKGGGAEKWEGDDAGEETKRRWSPRGIARGGIRRGRRRKGGGDGVHRKEGGDGSGRCGEKGERVV